MRKLGDWLTAFMEYTSNSEPALTYRMWTGISTIASVMQRKIWCRWDGHVTPNFFVILYGPSGEARKTTAMRRGRELLEPVGVNFSADTLTRERLIQRFEEVRTETYIPSSNKIVVQSPLTAHVDELVTFLNVNTQLLLYDMLKLFESPDLYSYETKTSGKFPLEGPWLNLIGGTTPDLFHGNFPNDGVGSGFTGRCIFVYEEKDAQICSMPALTPAEVELGVMLTRDLEQMYTLCGEMTFSLDFIDFYPEWYERQRRAPAFDLPALKPYNGRRQVHLMKLCMIMSMSRGDSMRIEGQDFQRALEVLLEVEKKMPRVFRGIGADSTQTLIPKIIHEVIAAGGTIPLKKLYLKFLYDVSFKDFQLLLAELRSLGFCRLEAAGREMMVIRETVASDDPGQPQSVAS